MTGSAAAAPGERVLHTAPRLVTCDRERDAAGVGAIESGAVLVEAGTIRDVGPALELAARYPEARRVEHPGLVTPGLVDAHTHTAWMGSRAREYAQRLAGDGYEAIAAAGGGIVATMRAVRAASTDEVAEALAARLGSMLALGVTTVEVKSGYGLSEADETKQLAAVALAVARGKGAAPLPRVVPTFLGLHAVPPEFAGDRASYARACGGWLDGIAASGLAAFVDAYVDRSAFSCAEARPYLERAKELGLGVRLHVGQFADVGGAELAADLGARSVDHLEHVSEAGLARLASAGVSAVLLPVASFTLAQAPPDVAAMRAAGLRLVVASDANPGTAPTLSLPLAMALAARHYGMTVPEVWLGVTRHAAACLDLDAGSLRVGAPADFVAWDASDEAELVQPWGTSRALTVVKAGAAVVNSSQSRRFLV